MFRCFLQLECRKKAVQKGLPRQPFSEISFSVISFSVILLFFRNFGSVDLRHDRRKRILQRKLLREYMSGLLRRADNLSVRSYFQIVPMIYDLRAEGSSLYLRCASGSEANLKPQQLLETMLRSGGLEYNPYACLITRLDLFARTKDGQLVSLEKYNG